MGSQSTTDKLFAELKKAMSTELNSLVESIKTSPLEEKRVALEAYLERLQKKAKESNEYYMLLKESAETEILKLAQQPVVEVDVEVGNQALVAVPGGDIAEAENVLASRRQQSAANRAFRKAQLAIRRAPMRAAARHAALKAANTAANAGVGDI